MKLITKDELNQKIGKANTWSPKQVIGQCEYTAGLPEIDEKLGEQNFFKTSPIVNLIKREKGLEIDLMLNFKYYYAGISITDIKEITIEKGGIIDVQSKSVLGRAIVGGLIFGPIGALIGGASGVKDKVIKESDNLVILAQTDEGERAILLSIKKGKTNDIYKFFKENYSAVFSMS
jgi:hypothetical protein